MKKNKLIGIVLLVLVILSLSNICLASIDDPNVNVNGDPNGTSSYATGDKWGMGYTMTKYTLYVGNEKIGNIMLGSDLYGKDGNREEILNNVYKLDETKIRAYKWSKSLDIDDDSYTALPNRKITIENNDVAVLYKEISKNTYSARTNREVGIEYNDDIYTKLLNGKKSFTIYMEPVIRRLTTSTNPLPDSSFDEYHIEQQKNQYYYHIPMWVIYNYGITHPANENKWYEKVAGLNWTGLSSDSTIYRWRNLICEGDKGRGGPIVTARTKNKYEGAGFIKDEIKYAIGALQEDDPGRYNEFYNKVGHNGGWGAFSTVFNEDYTVTVYNRYWEKGEKKDCVLGTSTTVQNGTSYKYRFNDTESYNGRTYKWGKGELSTGVDNTYMLESNNIGLSQNGSVTINGSNIIIYADYVIPTTEVSIKLVLDTDTHEWGDSTKCKYTADNAYGTLSYNDQGYVNGVKTVTVCCDESVIYDLLDCFTIENRKYILINSFIQTSSDPNHFHVNANCKERNPGPIGTPTTIVAEYKEIKNVVNVYKKLVNKIGQVISTEFITSKELLENETYEYIYQDLTEYSFLRAEIYESSEEGYITQNEKEVKICNSNQNDFAIYGIYKQISDDVSVKVYFKGTATEHSVYSSDKCLNINSTDIKDSLSYTYSKGENVDILVPSVIGKYKLVVMYDVEDKVHKTGTNIQIENIQTDKTIIVEYKEEVTDEEIESDSMADMTSNARGFILSENNNRTVYDVFAGIPTNKNVYTAIRYNSYLFNIGLNKHLGEKIYTVTVTVPCEVHYYCSGCICLGHSGEKVTIITKDDGTFEKDVTTFTYYCSGSNCDHCTCQGHTYSTSKTYTCEVKREYRYWTIEQYEIYKMKSAEIENRIFGNVSLAGNDAEVDASIFTNSNGNINAHVNIPTSETFIKSITTDTQPYYLSGVPSGEEIIAKANTDHSSYAEGQAEAEVPAIEVRNDALTVDGDILVPGQGGEDYGAPVDPVISQQVSSESTKDKTDILIPMTYLNGLYQTTKNQITYESQTTYACETGNNIVQNINGYSSNNKADLSKTPDVAEKVNDVVVHTPIYISATIESLEGNNIQKIKADNTINDVVVDKDLQIDFTMSGLNRNISGYNGDLSEFVRRLTAGDLDIEIRFPFDVYRKVGEEYITYEKENWYNISDDIDSTGYKGSLIIKIPVWTEEGIYDGADGIVIRVVSQNDPNPATDRETLGRYERNVHGNDDIYYTDLEDYRAYYNINVDVLGRVYDFRLEYTDDESFGKLMKYGFNGLKANQLPFGQNGIDNFNSNNAYGIKLGNKIKFSVKTKGTKSGQIKIEPELYYVKKSSGEMVQVDGYYQIDGNKYEKLSTASTMSVTTSLTKAGELPYIPEGLIINTKNIYNNLVSGTIIDRYWSGKNYATYNYNKTVTIGTIGKILLGENVRLRHDVVADYVNAKLYGDKEAEEIFEFAGGQEYFAKSISQWYGEFFLPTSSVFVVKGETLFMDGKMQNETAEGYIVVVFKIVTESKDTNGQWVEYLSYQLPNDNTQWDKENWNQNELLENKAGKIVLPNERVINNIVNSKNGVPVAIYDAKAKAEGSVIGQ